MKFVEAGDSLFTSAVGVGAFRGAVKNLDNDMYHSLKGYWSSSHLKAIHAKSPAHFKESFFGNSEPKKQTDAMALGSLVHGHLLEPHNFGKHFVKDPGLNKRTNEGKAAWQEFLAANNGKTIITDEMLFKAQCMRESAFSNPDVRKLLEPGVKEASYFWNCANTGLNLKAKLDQSAREHFVELKTTTDASPEAFARHAFNLNYDLSLYHYREGLRVIKDVEPPAYFIVIETEAPYVTQVYKVGEGFWLTGREKWLSAMNKLEAGIKRNEWPGYFPIEMGPQELNPPPWAINKTLPQGDFNGI